MKGGVRGLLAAAAFAAIAAGGWTVHPDAVVAAQDRGAQTVKGLAITPTAITRGRIVSLRDCPPGANTQRGVIRPIEDSEFVTISVSFKVLPDFAPVTFARPVLVDTAGNSFNTGQTFADLAAQPAYACDFSFRVPTGTNVASLVIDGVTFDLTKIAR